MAVNVTFSFTNGGSAITDLVDHGNSPNGQKTTPQTIYIRHDGSNSITDVGFYIRQISGTYSGSRTASADLAEMLEWGDSSTASTFGGFEINMNAVGAFPNSSWPTFDDKSPTGGDVFRTGQGDSEGNAIILNSLSGASSDGTLQAGSSPNVRFQFRIDVPSAEDGLGIRQFESIVRYNFTS